MIIETESINYEILIKKKAYSNMSTFICNLNTLIVHSVKKNAGFFSKFLPLLN